MAIWHKRRHNYPILVMVFTTEEDMRRWFETVQCDRHIQGDLSILEYESPNPSRKFLVGRGLYLGQHGKPKQEFLYESPLFPKPRWRRILDAIFK